VDPRIVYATGKMVGSFAQPSRLYRTVTGGD